VTSPCRRTRRSGASTRSTRWRARSRRAPRWPRRRRASSGDLRAARLEHGGLWRVDAEGGVLRCVETWQTPGLAFPGSRRRAGGSPSRRERPARAGVGERQARLHSDVAATTTSPRESREPGGPARRPGTPSCSARRSSASWSSSAARSPGRRGAPGDAGHGRKPDRQFAERKRAEAELETLFETSPDMLCIASLDGTFRG